MSAGPLRHPFELLEPVRTPDGRGGNTVAWSRLRYLWGSLDDGGAAEVLEPTGVRSAVTHTVRTRYADDVSSDHRLRLGTREFEITAVVDEGERRRWLRLSVAEEGR